MIASLTFEHVRSSIRSRLLLQCASRWLQVGDPRPQLNHPPVWTPTWCERLPLGVHSVPMRTFTSTGLNMFTICFNSRIQHRCLSDMANSAKDSPTENGDEPCTRSFRKGIRNIAVIAHVDHGKTSLVDQLLTAATVSTQDDKSTPTQSLNRLLDSGDLEKERGITITSKVTRINYDYRNQERIVINCCDTPGHSDFAGEVDRVIGLADGFLLVVDAAEGPKSQTKYVLSRALALGLKPIVVFNKCDRADAAARIDSGETESKVTQLFQTLGATDEQINCLTVYASAKQGWVTLDPTEALEISEKGYDGSPEYSMRNLLDWIVERIPEPVVTAFTPIENPDDAKEKETFASDKFSMASVNVGFDAFLGRLATGRITSGSVAVNDIVSLIQRSADLEGKPQPQFSSTVSGVFVYKGISRTPFEERAYAGDIITLAGVPDLIAVGDTLTSANNPVKAAIKTPPLPPPTLSMDFGANDGPLAGKEGKIVASSKIRERLMAEADNNVTLKVTLSESDVEKTTVFARGELQLGILVEQMRREGFEMIITPPRFITIECPETGRTLEPYEEVIIDVDNEFSGAVVSALTGDRKGIMVELSDNPADGKSRLVFEMPSRGLLGFNSEIASATRGSAVVNHLFLEHRPYAGNLGAGLHKGRLISNASGEATKYALVAISERGTLFIEPSDSVYSGMVIGENAKAGDLEVNPVRAKQVSNVRTVQKEQTQHLPPPKKLSVEELIGYMDSDEVIEVTPLSVRLRKHILDSSARQRASRDKAKQVKASKSKN